MQSYFYFLSLILISQTLFAGGIVGNGTANSCTVASLQNKLATGGIVTFNCGSTPLLLTLTSPLVINKNSEINGGNLIILSGNKTSRLIENNASLTLKNITLRDGYSYGADGGAAVWNHYRANLTTYNGKFLNNISQINPESPDHGGGAIALHGGTLLINGTQFINNQSLAGGGGAIHSILGNIAIKNSVFRNNKANSPGYSGAIYSDGTLEGGTNGFTNLLHSRFINNTGTGQGGAVFLFLYPTQMGSKSLITHCEFIGNKVTANQKNDALGGALRLGNGDFTVSKSSFINNSAQAQGGAIWTGEISRLNLDNSTFSGNQADLGGAITPLGSGNSNFIHNTIVFNSATSHGGAIFGGGNNIILTNNIIADNKANNPWNINHNCAQWLNSGGGNIQYPQRYATWDSNDHDCAQSGIRMIKPLLGTLAYYNHSYTQSYNLKANSPAINTAIESQCTLLDQNNVKRPQGLHCDVGSFEMIK